MITPTDRLKSLAAHLDEVGVFADPAWRRAFLAAPRHLFAPKVIWLADDEDNLVAVERDREPDRWWDAVYGQGLLVTQLDDGREGGDGVPTSSCSMPGVTLRMLAALGVEDGDRVLDVGTGTGWQAAMLCARVGDEQVTTVEIDQAVAEQARSHLARAGFAPHLAAGDGGAGYPDNAPYDRIICGCSVVEIPGPWIAQTRSGGVIVVPWSTGNPAAGDPLAVLTVRADGSASGRFGELLSFMRLRTQRARSDHGVWEGEPGITHTTVHPAEAMWGDPDRVFAIAVQVPGCHCGMSGGRDTPVYWWSDGRSWARVHTREGSTRYRVEQHGPRRLWDEVEAAHQWWKDAGEPRAQRFGLTVTPDQQTVWLDDPDSPVSETGCWRMGKTQTSGP